MVRVVAIIAAYNEADIIGAVVGDLIAQGLTVYLIDHGSSDDTAAEASHFLGRGLLHIERFPDDDAGRFVWGRILQRKQELAAELDGDWFIHCDADELRESPWPATSLREGISLVDRLGYNAIDHAVFNFRPTHDHYRRGDDLRTAFTHYEPPGDFDAVQIKAWKRLGRPVELARTGGHEAEFEGRRVFPIRFLLRHYPIRSQAQGEQKIFRDRIPRFDAEERERRWHIQYDSIRPGHRFVRDPRELIPFDVELQRVQLTLQHRTLHELLATDGKLRGELAEAHAESAMVKQQLEESLRGRDAAAQELARLLGSRTWRWSAAARRAWRLLGGR
jgi:glycosyltransferase involved in cell wall biosynthesis